MNERESRPREEQRRKAFDAGLFATGQEYAADLHQVLADAAKRNLDITMEALSYADTYQVGEQDRLRLAVLDSYRETQLALSEFTRDLLGSGGEGGEPASALPFCGASASSSRPETPSSPGLPAVEAEPVRKRGRGRPRKHDKLPGANGKPG